MGALGPVLAVLGAAVERCWGAMMKRMVADGDGQVRYAVFARNKLYKCYSGPVFFSHAVGHLVPDT